MGEPEPTPLTAGKPRFSTAANKGERGGSFLRANEPSRLENSLVDQRFAKFQELADIGCPPYYLFQGRPTAGNEPYKVPIVRGWEIFREALRYVFRPPFTRAKDVAKRSVCMTYKRNDEAYWLDQCGGGMFPGPQCQRSLRTGHLGSLQNRPC